MKRNYYLVMYDVAGGKGLINAIHLPLKKDEANVLLQEARATIYHKFESQKEETKFKVMDKRLFSIKNEDKTKETVFIICDVAKQS